MFLAIGLAGIESDSFGVLASSGSETPQSVLEADSFDIRSALPLFDKEVTVAGVVTRAKMTRKGDAIILDFNEAWRSHLSVAIPAALFPEFPEWKKLVGKRIQVTGTVIRFTGQVGHNVVDKPEIWITSFQQLAVIGEEAVSPSAPTHNH